MEEKSDSLSIDDPSSDEKVYVYKGFIGGIEVMNERYEFQVKNKVKQFYRYFLQFVKDLERELSSKYPFFQKDLEALNKMDKMKPESVEFNNLSSQLKHAQSMEHLYQEVIKTIKEFREIWKSS